MGHASQRRWFLAQSNGWGADLSVLDPSSAEGLRLDDRSLGLAHRAGGPLTPDPAFPTVGGLVLPPNVSADADEVWLADGERALLLRFDDDRGELRPAITVGGPGAPDDTGSGLIVEGRAGRLLVGWQGGRRLIVLDARSGQILDDLELPAGQVLLDFVLLDGPAIVATIVAGEDALSVLAWRSWGPSLDELRRVASGPAGASARLVADVEGRAYLFDGTGRLLPVEPSGDWLDLAQRRPRPRLSRAGVVRDLIRDDWRLSIGPGGTLVEPGEPSAGWPSFGPSGANRGSRPEDPVGPPPYVSDGRLVFGPLDGERPATVWDRVEVDLEALPPGAALELRTRTSDDREVVESISPWSAPSARVVSGDEPEQGPLDLAVLSAPGRYLWCELRLAGGRETPLISGVTVLAPRRSLADQLPHVFREGDEQSHRFLERLVSAAERTWEPIERAADDFARELDPATASDEMVDFLAAGFGVELDDDWPVEARRAVLRSELKRLATIGTRASLSAALRSDLSARWAIDADVLSRLETPFIWEHFAARRFGSLNSISDPAPTEAQPLMLFGRDLLGRVTLGASELGGDLLRDHGGAETDAVAMDAHRFTVFVPRALAPTDDDLRQLEHVIRRESPAGAVGTVERFEARTVVGVQSTLGVDAVLGDPPAGDLSEADDDVNDPRSTRLDDNAVLAGGAEAAGYESSPSTTTMPLPWRLQ